MSTAPSASNSVDSIAQISFAKSLEDVVRDICDSGEIFGETPAFRKFVGAIDRLPPESLKHVDVSLIARKTANKAQSHSRSARHPILYLIQTLKQRQAAPRFHCAVPKGPPDAKYRDSSSVLPPLLTLRGTKSGRTVMNDKIEVNGNSRGLPQSFNLSSADPTAQGNEQRAYNIILVLKTLFDRGVTLWSDYSRATDGSSDTALCPPCVDNLSGQTLLHTLISPESEDSERGLPSAAWHVVLRWLLSHVGAFSNEIPHQQSKSCEGIAPSNSCAATTLDSDIFIEQFPSKSSGLLHEESLCGVLGLFLFGLAPNTHLIDEGSKSLTFRGAISSYPNLPIQVAVAKGDLTSLEILMSAMVDLLIHSGSENARWKEFAGVSTSLLKIISSEHAARVAIINNFNLLHICAEHGHVHIARFLLSASMGLLNAEDVGRSAMIGLRGLGFQGNELTTQTLDGENDTHFLFSTIRPTTSRICDACTRRQISSIDVLFGTLFFGAHAPWCVRSRSGKGSPLHIACARGHAGLVSFFIGEVKARNIHMLDKPIDEGPPLTAIEDLISSKRLSRLQERFSDSVVGTLLLERDAFGRTALHCAAECTMLGNPGEWSRCVNADSRESKKFQVIEIILREVPELAHVLDYGGRNALELSLSCLKSSSHALAGTPALLLLKLSRSAKLATLQQEEKSFREHHQLSVCHLKEEERQTQSKSPFVFAKSNQEKLRSFERNPTKTQDSFPIGRASASRMETLKDLKASREHLHFFSNK